MPVEIKKLTVKALILNQDHNTSGHVNESEKLSEEDKHLIIEESVNQVMAILERKLSR